MQTSFELISTNPVHLGNVEIIISQIVVFIRYHHRCRDPLNFMMKVREGKNGQTSGKDPSKPRSGVRKCGALKFLQVPLDRVASGGNFEELLRCSQKVISRGPTHQIRSQEKGL